MDLKQALRILQGCASLDVTNGHEAFEVVKNALTGESQKLKEMPPMERWIRMLYENILADINGAMENPVYEPNADMEMQLEILEAFIKADKMYQEYLLSLKNVPHNP